MTTVRQLLDGKGRQVYSVGPLAPVLDAIRLMAEHRIGALLVMNGESLAGIVSERDYALQVLLRGRGGDTPVSDIISSAELSVTPDATVQVCIALVPYSRCAPLQGRVAVRGR